jgi:hypothetical protein
MTGGQSDAEPEDARAMIVKSLFDKPDIAMAQQVARCAGMSR